MSRKLLALLLGSALIGGGGAFAFTLSSMHVLGNPVIVAKADTSAQPAAMNETTIATALKSISYGSKVKQPSSLPFKTVGTYAEVHQLNAGKSIVQLTYVGADKHIVSLSVSDANVTNNYGTLPTSQVSLNYAKGSVGTYTSNGYTQEIVWHQDGLWYLLQYSTPGHKVTGSNALSLSSLTGIVNSLR